MTTLPAAPPCHPAICRPRHCQYCTSETGQAQATALEHDVTTVQFWHGSSGRSCDGLQRYGFTDDLS